MQTALDIGTINIQDPQVANFVQNKNIDEIKALFLNFLSREVKSNSRDRQHKWALFGQKMYGRINEKTADQLLKGSIEFRQDFSLRELDS